MLLKGTVIRELKILQNRTSEAKGRQLTVGKGGGGGGDGGHSLTWPIRVCAAEQGMVFKVLSLKQGIHFTINRPEQDVFLDWKAFK